MGDSLGKETVALYGLARGEFTAARNARAKELCKKDPELAVAVAALPKPSVSADAINVLAREDPSVVRALVQSGKRLRTAQEAAVAGKPGKGLNAAIDDYRTALEQVQRELRRRKLSGPALERASQTLRAASLDPELQPLLERGTLSEDLTAAGFGINPSIVAARPQERTSHAAPPRKPDRRAAEKKRREAQARLRSAEEALQGAEKRAAAALRELERAKEDVEQARRALDNAL